MKIVILFFSILFLVLLQAKAQTKLICITVDDLPTVTYNLNNPQLNLRITTELTTTFKQYHIPAIGYVNEIKLYAHQKPDERQLDLLRMWLKNDCDLGNHTYAHLDFNTVSDSVFFIDIAKGEIQTKKLLQEYGKTITYFRHPYLHAGMNEAKNHSLNTYLAMHGYTIAPVTVDNEDYLFAKFYHYAYLNKNDSLMKRIGKSYVDYMEKKLLYFEQKSQEVFGRSIAQTLLIHASLLNAEYMDELAAMYNQHGYTFVSQEKVLEDEAYHQPVTFYTKKGMSWIFRWGFSKGMSEELTKGDIETPRYIIERGGRK